MELKNGAITFDFKALKGISGISARLFSQKRENIDSPLLFIAIDEFFFFINNFDR